LTYSTPIEMLVRRRPCKRSLGRGHVNVALSSDLQALPPTHLDRGIRWNC
jgi:hypothetical protein